MKVKTRRYFFYYLLKTALFILRGIPLRTSLAAAGFLGRMAFRFVRKYRETAVDNFCDNTARNISNSTAEMLLAELADNNNYRVSDLATHGMLGGTVEYTMKDTVFNGEDRIKISVITNYNGVTKSNTLIVSLPESGFIPGVAKAAITTNSSITTLGNLDVDGRNHDLNGNLIPNSGTYGIWTTQSLNQSGSSDIGGTDDNTIDYDPSRPGDPNIIKINQVFPGGYPDTPDKVMGGASEGYPENTLKNILENNSVNTKNKSENFGVNNTNFDKSLKAIEDYISNVDDIQQSSDSSIKDLLTGKNSDITSVVSEVAKADLSFKLLVGVRNKLIEAYKQTMNMPI